ncbi:MAG: hypothetical protein L6R35_003329 [Caloplaca aegaea]|nr:MAG: hypothetical protein L6R35_003329 [Caloplaca aegaea]
MAPSVSSKRTSKRYSTYSSFMSSDNTLPSGLTTASHHNTHSTATASSAAYNSSNHNYNTDNSDPRLQEIKEWSTGFDRLENKRLQQQRYQPTPEKTDNLSKLALGAKVERALDRRMTDQDATFRAKDLVSEKPTAVTRRVRTRS